jgi:hypothetical protein
MFAIDDILEFRNESLQRFVANRGQERLLLDEERKFWRGKLSRAVTAAEVKSIREELDKLDEMEAASHG